MFLKNNGMDGNIYRRKWINYRGCRNFAMHCWEKNGRKKKSFNHHRLPDAGALHTAVFITRIATNCIHISLTLK
jgi:hypothetical protein